MEPRIQYAQTADGVSIAFWTLGEGMPFISMPAVFSNLQVEWQDPDRRRFYEQLAGKRKLVRYDSRGTGLSDRNVAGFSLEAAVLDLEAVVSRLRRERVALFAPIHSGPVAIAYAVRHPERVSHLLLWCSYVRGADCLPSWLPHQLFSALAHKDWATYTETVAHTSFGWEAGEQARRYAEYMRESVTPEVARAALEAHEAVDVTDLLPRVTSPTLVLQGRQASFPGVDVARGLASRIPDARLALLEGMSLTLHQGDTGAVLAAIDEFLGEGEEATGEGLAAGDVHTILFTDMEGSTTLTQRLGDEKAQELVRAHNTIVRDALKAHGGREIKHTGDGIMASFPSASKALECAIAIQRAVAGRAEEQPEAPLRVRIGLNAGEPVAEDQDLFGTAVQLAARICAHAEPGEIVASNVVRELAAGKGFLFSDRGDVALRGFEDPVRLYEVRWQD